MTNEKKEAVQEDHHCPESQEADKIQGTVFDVFAYLAMLAMYTHMRSIFLLMVVVMPAEMVWFPFFGSVPVTNAEEATNPAHVRDFGSRAEAGTNGKCDCV